MRKIRAETGCDTSAATHAAGRAQTALIDGCETEFKSVNASLTKVNWLATLVTLPHDHADVVFEETGAMRHRLVDDNCFLIVVGEFAVGMFSVVVCDLRRLLKRVRLAFLITGGRNRFRLLRIVAA